MFLSPHTDHLSAAVHEWSSGDQGAVSRAQPALCHGQLENRDETVRWAHRKHILHLVILADALIQSDLVKCLAQGHNVILHGRGLNWQPFD